MHSTGLGAFEERDLRTARRFRENLLETGVGVPGQSAQDNRNFDFYLATLLTKTRKEGTGQIEDDFI